MTTITLKIQIPDALAARWEALSEEEQEQFAAEALVDAFALADEEGEEEEAEPASYPLTPEDIASLGRGFADADAGRVVDGATFFKNLDAHIARLKAAKAQSNQSEAA
jgi:hypothetical protein